MEEALKCCNFQKLKEKNCWLVVERISMARWQIKKGKTKSKILIYRSVRVSQKQKLAGNGSSSTSSETTDAKGRKTKIEGYHLSVANQRAMVDGVKVDDNRSKRVAGMCECCASGNENAEKATC